MNFILTRGLAPSRRVIAALTVWLIVLMTGDVTASERRVDLPTDVVSTLKYLLDLVKETDPPAFDADQISALIAFILSPKPDDALYSTDDTFDAPSAYNQYSVDASLQRILDYTLDADIPSFFFWPSSLRTARWTRVEGGDEQLDRLRAASRSLKAPFTLRGSEHLSITPDQHTGAYYSYDVDKMVILAPYLKGQVMITIYLQQKPSAVGKKGWVLGEDDDWNYIYTREKGLNLKGMGWVNTYMYDSFGITVYYQPEPSAPVVVCGTFSWVKAGWVGVNMVRPKHIHRGLTRVAHAFTAVMEDPRLPEPAILAEAFATSEALPTLTLREFAQHYFSNLERRLASSETLWKKVGHAFDGQRLLEQMTRDELYAVLALDYLKKLLGRNPVLDAHPFGVHLN